MTLLKKAQTENKTMKEELILCVIRFLMLLREEIESTVKTNGQNQGLCTLVYDPILSIMEKQVSS